MVRTVSKLTILLLPFVEFALAIIQDLSPETRDLDGYGVFAGYPEGTIAREGRRNGVAFESDDRRADKKHNVLRPHGVGIAIQGILRLKLGGHLWLAPACSHYVFMCSSQHGRSRANTSGKNILVAS